MKNVKLLKGWNDCFWLLPEQRCYMIELYFFFIIDEVPGQIWWSVFLTFFLTFLINCKILPSNRHKRMNTLVCLLISALPLNSCYILPSRKQVDSPEQGQSPWMNQWENFSCFSSFSKLSLTQWTWVWANSGRSWRTGKHSVLHFTGSRRAGHDLATGQQQQVYK